jgi:hypothetical protein
MVPLEVEHAFTAPVSVNKKPKAIFTAKVYFLYHIYSNKQRLHKQRTNNMNHKNAIFFLLHVDIFPRV